ncbi:MAG: hypothetical protein ACXWSD_11375, partial [Bdellovibrionota bacterium]
MTRIRPLSPFEWAYVGATPAFPPFAIQLLVESSDEISRAALEAAVAAAFAANRLSGMKLCGAWWVEGEAPHLRDQAGDAENFQAPLS